MTFFGILGLFLALRAYDKVSACIDASGVTLREDGEERYFPKAFCLLPELIKEFRN